MQFVIDSVYALAFAIHDLLKHRCRNNLKECVASQQLDGEEVLKYIRDVKFTGL